MGKKKWYPLLLCVSAVFACPLVGGEGIVVDRSVYSGACSIDRPLALMLG